jgi:flagellin
MRSSAKEATVGLNSVNTNYGALVALQSLNNTNQQLANVQKRVTTGFRVNDAVDDGAAFAVAQGIRSNVAAIGAVNQQLNIAKGTVGTALEAATSISNTLIKIREVTTKLADGNLSSNQRAQYNTDLSKLVGEISNFVSNAQFNGTNLLNTVTAVSVIANVGGTQFTLTNQDIGSAVTTSLSTSFSTSALAAAALSAAGFQASIENVVATFLNNLGGDRRRLDNQINFNAALQKASEEALGFVVDADLAKESSRLQSLQIRQQLGTQTLGIANQSPQSLLGLFR